jgi:[ribosomal protein S18]-alanine N-acetyltransferase
MAAKESAGLLEEEFGAFSVSDALQIYNLDRRCLLSPWSFDGFSSELVQPYSYCWGKRDPKGNILAFIFSHIVLDEAHILKIGVAPEWREKGIAKRLMAFSLEQFQQHKVRYAYLEVRRSNDIARKFYESLGFIEDGVRKNYYGKEEGYELEAEDAIFYILKL